MGGVGKEGGGVSSFFPPSGKQQNAGKKNAKKTMRKSRGKGKKKEDLTKKGQSALKTRSGDSGRDLRRKPPRFGECREVRVDLISFFFRGRSDFGGEGAVLGCFPPFPQPQVGGVSSSSSRKKLFCPKVKLEEQECGSRSFP